MRISIICMDLSTSATLTAAGIADALASAHDVQIVGQRLGDAMSQHLAASGHRVIDSPAKAGLGFFSILPGLLASLRDSDLIIACKVRFPSFAPALLAKLLWRKPVVLYADDDEIAMTWPGRQRSWWARVRDPSGDLYTLCAVWLRSRADAIVVASSALQRSLGGQVIATPRALPGFDQTLYDREAIRSQLGIHPDDFVLGFLGIPRPHKGLDEVLQFVMRTELPNVRLLVAPPIGFTDLDHIRTEMNGSGGRILLLEGQPLSAVPRLLAACDAIPILQRASPAAEAQVPAKLVEAMAMGRAIVATAVSDIPEILAGAGLVLPPDRPDLLDERIALLYRDRRLSEELGQRARIRYLETLSATALGPRLRAVVENAARRR